MYFIIIISSIIYILVTNFVILFYRVDYFILKIGTLKRKTHGEILCKMINGRTLEEQE